MAAVTSSSSFSASFSIDQILLQVGKWVGGWVGGWERSLSFIYVNLPLLGGLSGRLGFVKSVDERHREGVGALLRWVGGWVIDRRDAHT